MSDVHTDPVAKMRQLAGRQGGTPSPTATGASAGSPLARMKALASAAPPEPEYEYTMSSPMGANLRVDGVGGRGAGPGPMREDEILRRQERDFQTAQGMHDIEDNEALLKAASFLEGDDRKAFYRAATRLDDYMRRAGVSEPTHSGPGGLGDVLTYPDSSPLGLIRAGLATQKDIDARMYEKGTLPLQYEHEDGGNLGQVFKTLPSLMQAATKDMTDEQREKIAPLLAGYLGRRQARKTEFDTREPGWYRAPDIISKPPREIFEDDQLNRIWTNSPQFRAWYGSVNKNLSPEEEQYARAIGYAGKDEDLSSGDLSDSERKRLASWSLDMMKKMSAGEKVDLTDPESYATGYFGNKWRRFKHAVVGSFAWIPAAAANTPVGRDILTQARRATVGTLRAAGNDEAADVYDKAMTPGAFNRATSTAVRVHEKNIGPVREGSNLVDRLVVDNLIDTAPFLMTTTAATLVGGPAGTMLTAFTIEASSYYGDALQRGVDPTEAAQSAMVYGTISTAIETAQIGQAFKIGKSAQKQLATRAATKMGPLHTWARMGREVLMNQIEEAIEESLQEMASEGVAWAVEGKAVDWSKIPEAATAGFFAYLLPMAAGMAKGGVQNSRQKRQEAELEQAMSEANPFDPEEQVAAYADYLSRQYGQSFEWGLAVARRASKRKGDFMDNLDQELADEVALTPEGLAVWANEDPETATALASIERPSRTDFENAGLPRRPARERQRIAEDLREILDAKKQEKTVPVEGKPEPDATPTDTTASVKMMITKADETALLDMGFSQAEIDQLTPEQAGEILAAGDDVMGEGDTEADAAEATELPPAQEPVVEDAKAPDINPALADPRLSTKKKINAAHQSHMAVSAILDAKDTGKVSGKRKKQFESAYDTLKTHADTLGIDLPKTGVAFDEAEYRRIARAVQKQLPAWEEVYRARQAKTAKATSTPDASKAETPAPTKTPTDEAGVNDGDVYRVKVTGRGEMFAVRDTERNPNSRQGDLLFKTEAEAKKESKDMARRRADAVRQRAQRDEKARKDAEAEAERNDTDGFAEQYDQKGRGRALKALRRTQGINGVYDTRRNHIRRLVAEGHRVVVGNDGRRRLAGPDETFLLEDDITKTGMDYAEHLLAKTDANTEPDATPAADTSNMDKSLDMSDDELDAVLDEALADTEKSKLPVGPKPKIGRKGATKKPVIPALSGHKTTLSKGWDGNVMAEGEDVRLLTDVKSMVRREALSPSDAKKMEAYTYIAYRNVRGDVAEKLWDEAIEQATQNVTVYGVRESPEKKIDVLAHAEVDGMPVILNADRAAYIARVTKADSIKGSGTIFPVVFYRGEQPVALLMPVAPTEAMKRDNESILRETPPLQSSAASSPKSRPVKRKGKKADDATDTSLADAAKHGVKGIGEAAQGLYELFGGSSTSRMGLSFDKDTYAKAKPHFQKAYREFAAAGADFIDFIRWAANNFGPGIRPYIKQFRNDLVAERKERTLKEKENSDGREADGDNQGAGAPGADADGGEGAASSGGPVSAGVAEESGAQGAGSGDNGVLGSTESDGGGGVPVSEISDSPVGVGGQPSAGGRGPSVSESGAGGHGVVPAAPGSDVDGADGAQSSVVGPGTASNGNTDLRKSDPIRLTRGQRRRINDQVKRILAEKTPDTLTAEDREVLRQYTGEGGLSSGTKEALNQHYTDYRTIRAIFRALSDAGVQLDNLLEPAVGSGNFVGHAPGANWTTVDIDETNHRVAKALYPAASHYLASFEEFTASGFDAIISNVPFLETRGAGRRKARPDIKALHDFYFVHALKLVRDDGVVAFVTSSGTMDKLDSSIRKEIVDQADVIGCYRLPGGHFSENAHTDVIVDVIFLHKRPSGVSARAASAERNALFVNSTKTSDDIALNEWYQTYPQSVLGTLVAGKNKLYGGRPAYEVRGEADFGGMEIDYKPYGAVDQSDSGVKSSEIPTTYREFVPWANAQGLPTRLSSSSNYAENVILVNGEVLVARQEVVFEDVTWKAKLYDKVQGETAAKITALDGIVTNANKFQAGDENAATEGLASIKQYREAFVKPPHTDRELKKFFRDHNEETYFSELTSAFDRKWNPAAVWSEKTRHEGSGRIEASSSDSMEVRAVASEDNRGRLKLNYKEGLAGKNDLVPLLDNGYALAGIDDGMAMLQNDILYYSGNIYKKLDEVSRLRELVPPELAPHLDKQDGKLREILPEPKPLAAIAIKGTESWLTPFYRQLRVPIGAAINDNGIMEFSAHPGGSTNFSSEEAKVLEKHLNNHVLVSQAKDESVGSYMLRMRAAEAVLQSAHNKLKTVLADNEDVAERIEYAFNSRYRNYVKPDYRKAQYLIQPALDEIATTNPKVKNPKTGKMVPFQMRQNQVSWAVQALYEGLGINAHDVGGGKTIAAIVLGRALKLRGRAKKPMYVVPAKTIKKWVRETKLLYPNAKIVELGNLSKKNRNHALFELANENADFVFISHEGFEQIKLPSEVEAQYVNDIMNEHVDDPNASKRQAALIQQKADDYIDALLNDGRDTRLTWDKLGIDCIIADEAHAFKNIGVNNQLVRFGLGTSFGFNKSGTSLQSSRSYDFRFKANYTTERNNGGNVFLLTATPTPNKPMEVYTMLRHFGKHVFDDYGITNDREFASQFFVLGTVQNPANGKPKSILKSIVNAQDLRGILNRFVDHMSMEDMPWITVPESRENRVLFNQSDGYAQVAQDLMARQNSLPHPSQAGDDTLVAIYTGGRSASVDPRLYGGAHANVAVDMRSFDASDDKMQWTVESIAERLGKNPNGGQLVFVDDSGHSQSERGALPENLHRELKAELVARGIPAEQIAIINGKEITNPDTHRESSPGSKSDERKAALQDAYNAGKIKVLIGSTTSMGEGMDLQVKTTDIYHMDIPYTPGAIRQRNGRGVRPGNENDLVNIHYLLMRGSFDRTSLDLVQTKKGWNEALWAKTVADTISTEEEMTAGVIPGRKQILLDLETDPLKRKRLEVEFRLESMHQQAGSWRNEYHALELQEKSVLRQIQNLQLTLAERQKRLEDLVPDDRIKDDEKRAEQYKKSKDYLQRLIETTQRKISELRDTDIVRLQEGQQRLADQIATLSEDIRQFTARWFDKKGESLVTLDDIDAEDAGGDTMGYAPRPSRQSRPTRSIGGRRQDGGTVENIAPTQTTAIVDTIRRLWPELSVRGKATFIKRAPGWYVNSLGEMRLADAGNIVVAVHELGHHFDRQMGMWSKQKGLPSGIPSELARLGRDLYGDVRPKGGYKAEGFAEFIGHYLTGGDIAQRAPALYRWFTMDYLPANPQEARKLRELEDTITRFQMQTPEQAIEAMLTPRKRDWSGPRIAANVLAGTTGIATTRESEARFIDAFLPLLRGMQDTGADLDKLKPSKHPFMLATFFARTSGGRTLNAMLSHSVDLHGRKNGESLRSIFAPAVESGQVDEVIKYWIAKRIATRYHQHDLVSGLSVKDANAIIAKYQSETFDRIVEGATEWAHKQLHLLVDAGVITQATFDKIVDMNPIYAPMMRQFLEEEKRGAGKGRGKGIYRVKGGSQPILDPLTALAQQTERLHQIAMQHAVLRSLVEFYDTHKGSSESMGRFLSEVPAPREAVSFSMEQIQSEVAAKAVELGADIDAVAAAMMEAWDDKLTIFRAQRDYKGKDNIVAIEIDGRRRFFEVQPDLLPILEGVTQSQFLGEGIAAKAFRGSTGLLRLGATGVNPAFGLIRNLLRDTATASITGEYHFHVPVVSTLRGMLMDIANSESARMYHGAGLDIVGRVSQDLKGSRKAGRRVTERGGKRVARALFTLGGLREILGHSEIGPRLMEFHAAYQHALKQEGWDDSDAMVLAGCASKDVTVNFSRGGADGRKVNEVIPFYNAALQGIDKAVRAFGAREAMPWAKYKSRRRNLTRTMVKGAVWLTIAALANYWRNRDEDWWKELPPYEKWNYIHIKTWGNRPPIRVPLPFEMGSVFAALPVAVLEDRRTPGTLKEALGNSIQNALPLEMGMGEEDFQQKAAAIMRNVALLAPMADVIGNEDWKGSPIIPRRLEDRLSQYQYDDDTTPIARYLGQHTPGLSPLEIDHMLTSYTGGLYRRTFAAIEMVTDPSSIDTSDPSSLPIVGTLFVRPGTSRIVGDFYDRLSELKKRKGSDVATLEELGELVESERLARTLTDQWKLWRQDKDKELMADIQERVRSHQARDDFRKAGLSSVLYSWTAPASEAAEQNKALLSGVTRDEALTALRDEARRRGHSTKIRTSTGKPTAFGRRVIRLNGLLDE